MKKYLLEVLLEFLEPIRSKRLELAKDPAYVMDLLLKGNTAAAKMADQTLFEVKLAMGINYFSSLPIPPTPK